ncbi:MAG: colicin immunity domain-containing protein [Fibromonadaceae bacterium]|jgi:hypothetical protein|nr:colicin immunity domain-containing protein [Fibromonadaceae bacterium]
MVERAKLLDRIHLQKYTYMISQLILKEITAKEFQTLFLKIRREDYYWLSGSFEESTVKILDTFFLDVDEYAPDDLYDPDDPYNINEEELYIRAESTLKKLKRAVGTESAIQEQRGPND